MSSSKETAERSRFRICFVSSRHPAFDKRVFQKEARSLSASGYRVSHLCWGEERSVVVEGVTIDSQPRRKGAMGRFMSLWGLYRRAVQRRADVYHCNEIDSWLQGVLLKLTCRVKVVFDVHEIYPAEFAERRFPKVLQPAVTVLVRLLFRLLIPFTDRLVFAKKSASNDYPGTEHKRIRAENFAVIGRLTSSRVAAKVREEKAVTAIHTGSFNRVRGWPTLLQAMALMRDQTLRVHVVGKFFDGSRTAFMVRAEELGLGQRIHLEDWMVFEEAQKRVERADIGLILFQPGLVNHTHALPHKMFDYMLAGLPVIAPEFAVQVSNIIRGADCGILVDPADPESVADALDRLVESPQERRRLGGNGREAVLETFNWNNEARKLIAMYDELLWLQKHPSQHS